MNKRGIITVKLLIMISVVIISSGGMITFLVSQHSINQVLRHHKVQAMNALMNFDTDLYAHYGLYGLLDQELIGSFQSRLYPVEGEISATVVGNLDDPEILKEQILAFMKFRMPGNYMDQFLSRMKIIKKAEASKNAMDLKTLVDGAFTTIDSLYEQEVLLSMEVNAFDMVSWQIRENQMQEDYHDLTSEKVVLEGALMDAMNAWDALRLKQEEMEVIALTQTGQDEAFQLKLLQVQRQCTAARQVYEMTLAEFEDHMAIILSLEEAYGQLIQELEALLETHYDLMAVILAIEVQENKINALVENTRQSINALDAIPEVVDNINQEMTNMIDQMARLKSDIKASVQQNIEILEDLTRIVETIGRHQALDVTEMNTLNTYDALRNKSQDPESELTYAKMKAQGAADYTIEAQGRDIPKNRYQDPGGGPSFWSLPGILKAIKGLYENMTVNEYIVSTFKAFSASSSYDYDYFYKYERPSFFQRAEVEYILFGDRQESKNILKTTGSIFAVRVVMNSIHVYLDQDKVKLSTSIGYGVAGWSGLGAALVTNVIRVGWATLESFLDMNEMIKGNTVSFLKIYPEEWTLDIGLVKPEGKRQGVQFSYHDYLRILLLTLNEETKLKRVNHLIELNLYTLGKPSDLGLYATELKLVSVTNMGVRCESNHGYD